MHTLDLTTFVVAEVYAFLLLFSRLGSTIMLMPAIGDSFVTPRARLLLAAAISFLLMPVLKNTLPAPPDNPMSLFVVVGGEILYGLFLGGLMRLILGAIHTAGLIIATQSSLASAMLFDPSQGAQGTTLGNFMTLMVLVLTFTTGLHHTMLITVVDSYTLFAPGSKPPVEDFAQYAVTITSKSFALAFQLSGPVIIVTLMMYVSGGVMSRLMPAMQIFFVMVPIQVLLSFFLMATLLSGMMLAYMDYFHTALTGFTER